MKKKKREVGRRVGTFLILLLQYLLFITSLLLLDFFLHCWRRRRDVGWGGGAPNVPEVSSEEEGGELFLTSKVPLYRT